MPLNIVMDDLRMTRSVDFTIENILEGRLQAPPVSIDTTLKFLYILPPSNFTINTVKFKLQGSFHGVIIPKLSHIMRKPTFCICENKDADQLRGNREADQRLCFRYKDSAITLLPKSEISSL